MKSFFILTLFNVDTFAFLFCRLVKSFPLAVAVPNQDLNSPYDLVCLNWAK